MNPLPTLALPRRLLATPLAATLAALSLGLGLPAAVLAATVGQPAPAFELKDTQGRLVKLADFKGRHVVLEWTNPGCPFVQKHYGAKNMQALQKDYAARNVVWLSINSTARGAGDYLAPAALSDKLLKDWGAAPTAVLMDEPGSVGRAYAARTTPHMYIVNPAGTLVYAGGIDDKRSANPADIPTAKNFVRVALDELLAGKPVSQAATAPYGCSIKYEAG
jgi:AhpC/TSA family